MDVKRQRIDTGSGKRFVRRDERGRFTSDQSEVGRSLATDRRREGQHPTPPGQGDRGDRAAESRDPRRA
jgi:hypothetical protein